MGGGKSDFQAFDTPNDSGKSITLRWPASPDESNHVEYVYMSLLIRAVRLKQKHFASNLMICMKMARICVIILQS